MTRFERVQPVPPTRREIKNLAKRAGESISAVERAMWDIHENDEMWVNDGYIVHLRRGIKPKDWPEMIHLSIKRRDKQPIHDWRDLQEIKNQLVGRQHEGVELYPAESRKVDVANQFHIYVMAERGLRFPFGFTGRHVVDGSGDIEVDNTRQRPL